MAPIDFSRRTALYRLYDAADALLYVGIAFDPEARWRYHDGSAAWWPRVARKQVEWLGTRLLALKEESRVIAAERPLYNKRGSQIPAQVPRAEKPRFTPNRLIRVDDATWDAYGHACAAKGISRSADMRMHVIATIEAYRREQRREARDAAATVAAEG